jgi:HEAT repeat protein
MKLKSLLKLENRVRWRAIAAGAAPQSEKRIAAVTARLSHPVPTVRKHAAQALEILSDERSAEALIATLEDHNIEVVKAALTALSSLRQPSLLGPMSSCMHHPSPRVRQTAAREIGNTRLKEALPHLLSAIYDEDASTLSSVLWILSYNEWTKEL